MVGLIVMRLGPQTAQNISDVRATVRRSIPVSDLIGCLNCPIGWRGQVQRRSSVKFLRAITDSA